MAWCPHLSWEQGPATLRGSLGQRLWAALPEPRLPSALRLPMCRCHPKLLQPKPGTFGAFTEFRGHAVSMQGTPGQVTSRGSPATVTSAF